MQGAYDAYEARVGEVDFESWFAKNLYHVPFGGITFRAHKSLLGRQRAVSRDEAWDHYARRTLPSLTHNRRMGGTYGASTFVAMLGLVDTCDDLRPGDRLGIYAYGSGSCAEFYSARVGERAREVAVAADLGGLLDARQPVDVATYESIERERDAHVGARSYHPDLSDPLYASYRDERRLVLRGIDDYVRDYGWSA